jgi:hypothetical protein
MCCADVVPQEWQHFKRQADELHERVEAAKEDAGGTRAELQHKLDRVCSCKPCSCQKFWQLLC